MKHSLTTTIVLLAAQLALAPLALAQDTATTNPQHQRMRECNTEAKTKALKGPERKNFMKECLGDAKKGITKTQQEKMKSCNADAKAKGVKGPDRRTFMSDCLKN